MKFKPYHYDHIDKLIRYYALSLTHPEITTIMDNGIQSQKEAKAFCDFISAMFAGQASYLRSWDER